MTVEELIEKLKELPQDMNIQLRRQTWNEDGTFTVEVDNLDYISIIDDNVTFE